MDTFGNALNTYGKIQAWFGLVVALSICTSLTSSGISIIRKKPEFTNSYSGIASNVVCASNVCTATVTHSTFTLANQTYPAPLQEGSTVTIYSNNDKTKFSTVSDVSPKWFGPGLISTGVCILVVAIIMLYFVQKYRGVSQVTGGLGLLDMVKQ